MSRTGTSRPYRSPRGLLVVALSLTLVALVVALEFVRHTTGGTLFLFTTVSPTLVLVSVFLLARAFVQDYRHRHRLFTIKRYDAGEIVFREGDEGDCAYFIRKGAVEVVADKDGTVIATRGPGEYFGEMALISNAPRSATIRTTAPTEFALLGKENFLDMMRVMPAAEEEMLSTVRKRAMEARDRRGASGA
jgi:CRP-like cAMP-binding protein